jgi:hypothetical protein
MAAAFSDFWSFDKPDRGKSFIDRENLFDKILLFGNLLIYGKIVKLLRLSERA